MICAHLRQLGKYKTLKAQHLASARAVFISQHAPSCCIFRTGSTHGSVLSITYNTTLYIRICTYVTSAVVHSVHKDVLL